MVRSTTTRPNPDENSEEYAAMRARERAAFAELLELEGDDFDDERPCKCIGPCLYPEGALHPTEEEREMFAEALAQVPDQPMPEWERQLHDELPTTVATPVKVLAQQTATNARREINISKYHRPRKKLPKHLSVPEHEERKTPRRGI